MMAIRLTDELEALAMEFRKDAQKCYEEEVAEASKRLLEEGFSADSEEYAEAMEEVKYWANSDYFRGPFGTRNYGGLAYQLYFEIEDYLLFSDNPSIEDYLATSCYHKTIEALTAKFGKIFA